MSKYLERARELRAATERHYNCAQSVIVPFAEAAGIDEETACRVGANFDSGMKMGSVCGVVTGGLMTLGLLGIDSQADVHTYCRRIRENHDGCLLCKDLLRMNAERGGQRKPHCDAMVYEAVALVEEMAAGEALIPQAVRQR